ncbi:MAG: ATP-binding protein [Lentisphaeria bacterium]|nr:ATP-binding protein [Lentisphaeria bacterium]
MGTFAINQYYNFDSAGLEEEDNGNVFIYLKYNGESTLPGFPHFSFRVKAYPCQIAMPPERFPQKIRCLVKDLIPNRLDPDQDEQFPTLVQDRAWLLSLIYVPGFTYEFAVIGQGAGGKYTLKDIANGIEHYNYESATELRLGDKLSLVVQDIKQHYLILAQNRYDAVVGAKFKVGQNLDFTIRKVKPDENNRQFLQLVDKTRGFWHRFYLENEEVPPNTDSIRLEIGEITPEGWLCLQHPGTRLSDIQKIRQADSTDFGREDEQREFKSTIVFPPRDKNAPAASKRQPDFSTQLRLNIMKVIASFMNTQGGSLFIGVTDDGNVCGIEGDLPKLNEDWNDQYNGQYKTSTDGYELKLRNAISAVLGDFANSLVTIRFYKVDDQADSSNQRVFCEVVVKAASTPIFHCGTRLFIRAGNSTRLLLYGDITSFILEKMRNQQQLQPQPQPAKAAPPATATLPDAPRLIELTGSVPLVPAPKSDTRNWGTLSFLPDGCRQFGKAVSNPAPVAALRLTQEHRKSKYLLLQCYACGNVNAVSSIGKKLPSKKNLPYKGGWNSDDALRQVFVCCPEDYLVIRSQGTDGIFYAKAIQVKDISAHDSLTAQGNNVLDPSQATVTSYQVVSERLSSFIYDIISKKRNGDPGQNTALIRIQDCIAFLDKQQETATVA